jgi:3,4-dihydroxy 2-butanone 4-phosphate synthase/GTP cyclohydrolase II
MSLLESQLFATVEEALDEIRAGRMVVVCDDEDRENEGDLTIAAELVTGESINFMAKEGRGLICLALTADRCEELGLDAMTARNESRHETAFTGSIDARRGVTTGISAADRARTIQVAVADRSTARDLVQPGHVFPLRARPAGVLERPGQTEAAVDLPKLAGLKPAGVICEILNDDGTMARVDDLGAYCARHGLKMITVAQLIAYRRRHDPLIERAVTTALPTAFGEFTAVGYRSLLDDRHHVALVKGEPSGEEDVLVSIHAECLSGGIFHSLRCDCRRELEAALETIERAGRGVVVYLSRGGRGLDLLGELRGSALQGGACAGRTEAADHDLAAQVLSDLGVTSIRVLRTAPAAELVGVSDQNSVRPVVSCFA